MESVFDGTRPTIIVLLPIASRDKAFLDIFMQFSIGKMLKKIEHRLPKK